MTSKEKAKELVDKFKYNTRTWNFSNGWEDRFYNAKDCALIAVDEILKVLNDYWNQDCKINNTKIGYYEEVKQEIEKL
jgi:uncharacterized protein YvpB